MKHMILLRTSSSLNLERAKSYIDHDCVPGLMLSIVKDAEIKARTPALVKLGLSERKAYEIWLY